MDRNFMCPLSGLGQIPLWHSWLLCIIGGVDFLFCATTEIHGILFSPHIQKFFIACQANLFPRKGNAYPYNQIQTK